MSEKISLDSSGLVYYINFQQGIIPAGSYVTVPN